MIEKILYRLWKWSVTMRVRNMEWSLFHYQLLIYINLEGLDTVFEYGGLKEAQNALMNWPINLDAAYKDSIKKLFSIEEQSDRRVTITTDSFVLQTDAAFGTVASLLKKLDSISEKPKSIRVNGINKGAGHWLRPGDHVEIQ